MEGQWVCHKLSSVGSQILGKMGRAAFFCQQLTQQAPEDFITGSAILAWMEFNPALQPPIWWYTPYLGYTVHSRHPVVQPFKAGTMHVQCSVSQVFRLDFTASFPSGYHVDLPKYLKERAASMNPTDAEVDFSPKPRQPKQKPYACFQPTLCFELHQEAQYSHSYLPLPK